MKKYMMAAAMLAALASSPATASDVCLRVGQIYSWDAVNDRTLIVEDNWHKKFKLKLMGLCNNLKFHERVGFRAIGGSDLSCLSRGDDVIVRDFAFGLERCPITDIQAYTPEMQKADRAAAEAAKAQHTSY